MSQRGRLAPGANLTRPGVLVQSAAVALLALTAVGAGFAHAGIPRRLGSTPSEMKPPPLRVTTRDRGVGAGDIFIAPAGGRYAAGPEILTTTGRVVWFHRLVSGDVATDFRTQTYLGRPVLTWMQTQAGGLGAQDGPGGKAAVPADSVGYIYNDRYKQIATVHAGNGYALNFHEFLITPQNTAYILADTTRTADLTAMGGRPDQKVLDNLVQEIDIKTGRVLFEWDPIGHIPYTDSYQGLPSSADRPWDWLHLNAVHLDRNGSLLLSSRNTWTVYDVSRRTGHIEWQLGGRRSSFRMRAAPGQALDHAGKIFSWQHDPEAIGHDDYTVFDDESGGRQLCCSRAVTLHLDRAALTATLIASDYQPERKVARAMGNAETMADGSRFVGWGSLPDISEFSRAGKLVFNAVLPKGVDTYRAYLLPWHPHAGNASGSAGQAVRLASSVAQ